MSRKSGVCDRGGRRRDVVQQRQHVGRGGHPERRRRADGYGLTTDDAGVLWYFGTDYRTKAEFYVIANQMTAVDEETARALMAQIDANQPTEPEQPGSRAARQPGSRAAGQPEQPEQPGSRSSRNSQSSRSSRSSRNSRNSRSSRSSPNNRNSRNNPSSRNSRSSRASQEIPAYVIAAGEGATWFNSANTWDVADTRTPPTC